MANAQHSIDTKENNMEQNFIIATASTADLTREYLDEHRIPFIRYSYVIGDEAYEDDCREETRKSVYEKMRAGSILSTSTINSFSYHEFFEPLLQQGKDILFLDMSRALSSSWRFCEEAIEELKEEYPERTIINVDTCCVSGGLGLLVEKVIDLYEAGKSMENILDWIEANKLKIAHRFTVDDLNWLKRGGRVSNASALVGTLLSIKPVLYVPDDGTLMVASKVRGRKNALNTILNAIQQDVKNPDGMIFRINHADCMEDAEYVRGKLLELFPTIKEITITGLGVVIGAHCGPGLFTIFYTTDCRRAE